MEIFHKLLKSSRGPPKHTTLSWPQKAPITSLACYLRHRSHRPRTLLTASLWGHSLWPAGARLARPRALAGLGLSGCLCGGDLGLFFLVKEETLEKQNRWT